MKTKKLWMTAIAVLFLAAFVGGCKDENVGKIGKCPTVTSTDPKDLATGVPLDKVISITFNEAMNPATITPGSLTLVDAAGNGARIAGTKDVSGKLTYDAATYTMSYTPAAKLKNGTTYTATVATSVKDLIGNALQTNYIWKFTTVAVTGPTVLSTSPANNATGVARNKIVTATFSTAMDPLSITTTTFTVKQGATSVAGSVSYTGTTASFKPTSALATSTIYTGTITTGAKDVAGTALASNYVWTFTTGALVVPTVLSTDPANNATGVALNKIIGATFSAPMDALTINTTTFTLKQGVTPVTGAVSYSGTTASFTPSSLLTVGTIYTGTITTGAMDVSGTPLASNYVWTFTTGAVVAPTVLSTDPANLATGVALNKVISATFSEVMDPLTITTSTFTLMNGATAVSGAINYAGTTATFTPSVNLLSNSTYTATITTGAKNPGGTALANDYVWNFNTNSTLGAPFVDLKSVARFGIIAGVGVSNNSGPSVINNLDVGISPGVRSSITGFPPATIVGGAIYASDDIAPPGVAAMLTQAKQDLTDAYLFAEGATAPAPAIISGDQGGLTLAPGIYKSTSSLLIQLGDLTLDAQGDANAVWIFQIASTLTTVGGSPFPSPSGGNVKLTGGAQAKNVFWQVASSATIGDYTSFQGNILALSSITMNTGAQAVGRMLARNSSVVMTGTNIINKP